MFPLLVIGFIALLGQVVLLREVAVAAYGIELSYLLSLGLWLLGSGLGAVIGRRRASPPERGVSVLLLVYAALLPLEIALIRGSRVLLGGVTGAYLPFAQQMAEIALAVLPISVLCGWLFQWAAKEFVERGKSLAVAYGIESAGSALGGIASTLLVAAHMRNSSVAAFCAFVLASNAFYMQKGWLRFWGGILSIALLGAFIFSPQLDLLTTSWNHPHLASVFDTPYGRVAVTKAGGQISVYENDALSFETQGTSAEETAHLAALAHDNPQTMLVLGGGLDGTIAELLKHHPQHVDVVELNRRLHDELMPQLPPETQASLHDARVHVQFGDPRRALKTLGEYDLILVGTAEPNSGQTNRFFTREFFALAQEHLNAKGILAFRLRSAENFWPPLLLTRNGSIVRAASLSFKDVLTLPGTTVTVLASNDTLVRDPTILAERYHARNLSARLVTPEYLRYLYTNDRTAEIRDQLARGDFAINSDARPICYGYAISIWLSKFFPTLLGFQATDVQFFGGRARTGWAIFLAIAIILFWLARRRPHWRASLLAGMAGFGGMLLETMLLLYYQSKSGVLFQNIGWLLTAFMLGLALGAALTRARRRFAAVGSSIALCIISLLFLWILQSDADFPWPLAGALLVLSGFFVGASFARASHIAEDNPQRAVSALYAADLVGGCLGTLLGSLILIPLAGMMGTAVVVIGSALLMAILI